MIWPKTVFVWSRPEIFVGSDRIRDSSNFMAGQRRELADTKFLMRCPCQVSVLG